MFDAIYAPHSPGIFEMEDYMLMCGTGQNNQHNTETGAPFESIMSNEKKVNNQ
jgi:hypothetical protein